MNEETRKATADDTVVLRLLELIAEQTTAAAESRGKMWDAVNEVRVHIGQIEERHTAILGRLDKIDECLQIVKGDCKDFERFKYKAYGACAVIVALIGIASWLVKTI